MGSPIRFGVLYGFRNPPSSGLSFPAMYRQVLEQVQLVDGLGYDHVWITEHHFVDDGYMPSPLVVSGAIAALTTRVAIGQDVMLVPFLNPVRLAEDLAVLDNLSDGRIMLGAGMGYVPSEFAGMGVERRQRRALMDDALAVLQLAWRHDEFDFDGEVLQLRGVRVRPRPVQPGGPPLWIAAMSEAGARRAVRFDAHLLPQGDPDVVLEPWRQATAGTGERRVGICRHFVVDDRDEPTTTGGAVLGRLAQGAAAPDESTRVYERWFAEVPPDDPMMRQLAAGEQAGRLLPQDVFIGSAAACADEVQRMHDVYGVTDVIVAGLSGSGSPEASTANLRRFAEEVVPLVRTG
jgi:alkanesulfonate monooxygenase SsuD/methylene tetrahydromethanopterin reductase-like flavin-dependent oxidoreductase (luciferase family)